MSRRDVAWALGVAAAALAVYLLTPQTRVYGDGVWMVSRLPPSPQPLHVHPLYRPAYEALSWITPRLELLDRARLLSQLSAALGLAGTFLIARAFALARRTALLACGLLGLSPLVTFFATQIEVHALHFACVVLCACVTLFVPWRRPVLALVVTALSLPLAFLSHQMFVLLGPGWVLLVEYACRRQGLQGFGPRKGLFVVGPLLLGGMAAGLAFELWLQRGDAALDVSRETAILETFVRAEHQLRMLWAGWLKPVAWLAPLGALGLVASRSRRLELWTLSTLVGVPWVFLIGIYDVTEKGGFFLGSAPFLAVCAGRGLDLLRARGWVVALLLATQALAAWAQRRTFDYGYDPKRRVELVREVLGGDRGFLVIGHPLAPRIDLFLPDVKEVSLERLALRMAEEDLEPESIGELLPWRGIDPAQVAVAIDLNYAAAPDFEEFSTIPEFAERFEVVCAPYFAAFREWLEASFVTELHEDEFWPMLRLVRRR